MASNLTKKSFILKCKEFKSVFFVIEANWVSAKSDCLAKYDSDGFS